jgi:hypothetical protein
MGFGDGLGVGFDFAVNVGLVWELDIVHGLERNGYLFGGLHFHAHIGT